MSRQNYLRERLELIVKCKAAKSCQSRMLKWSIVHPKGFAKSQEFRVIVPKAFNLLFRFIIFDIAKISKIEPRRNAAP